MHDAGLVRRARRRAAHRRAGDRAWTSPRTGVELDTGEALAYAKLLLATGVVAPAALAARAPTWTASATCAPSPTPTGSWPTLSDGGPPRGDRRRRLDRPGGRRGRPHLRQRGHRRRAAADPAARRPRPRDGGGLRRGCTARTASTCPHRHRRSREFRGSGVGVAPVPADGRRRAARRPRRGRRRRGAEHRARRGGRARGRQRRGHRRTRCARRRPTSSPPATSRRPSTRSTAGTSASSTGPTRSTAARPRPARCSGRT